MPVPELTTEWERLVAYLWESSVSCVLTDGEVEATKPDRQD